MATRGTGFINAQTYANLNRQGGQRVASALDDFIATQQMGAENAQQAVQDAFNGQVRDTTLRYDPNSVTTSAEAKQRAGQQYEGPNSLQDIDGYNSAVDASRKAEQTGALGADFYGRQALLSEKYGKGGGYTPGMSRFDSFLAGANGGQGMFEARKQSTSGLGQRLTAATQASQQRAHDARTASTQAADAYGQRADVLESQERNATQAAQRQAIRDNQREQAEERDLLDENRPQGPKRRGRNGGSALDSWSGYAP